MKNQFWFANLFLQIAVIFCSLASAAKVVESYEYGYKFSDPLITTIAAGVIYQKSVPGEVLKVPVLNRRVEDYRKYKNLLTQFYSAGKKSNELLFVIAGLGATKDSNISIFLAQLGLKSGKSVVSIPNTFTEDFVISSSKTGIVGSTQRDVLDLYQALLATQSELKKRGYNFVRTSIVGYSHGGLLAANISHLDSFAKNLNIVSTLMINPPVDLLYGMNQLDAMEKQSRKIGQIKLISKALKLQKIFKKSKNKPTTNESFGNFIQSVELTPVESEIVIGKVLMRCLGSTILAGQSFNDFGILPEAGVSGSAGERYQNMARRDQAKSYNFLQYLKSFLYEDLIKQVRDLSIKELNDSSSLKRLENYFLQNKNIFVLHNANDFLLQSGEVEWLENTFSTRARVYPRGGHMGNLWYSDNVAQVNNWLVYRELIQ